MGGGSVPYHLRPNKTVDKLLLVELLRDLSRECKFKDYMYVGFGGPFLDDFRMMHDIFDIQRLVSLEISDKVLARQKFNLPYKCIETELSSARDFIKGYESKQAAIFWLDYTDPAKLKSQLEDVQMLLPKLEPMDIVKITLNANPNTLGEKQGKTVDVFKKERWDALGDRIDELLPTGVGPEDMDEERFPFVLVKTLQFATQKSFEGKRGRIFQPLTAFVYNDGAHQMLTLTGIILEQVAAAGFLERTKIADWEFANTAWIRPQRINVPVLGIKERLEIDRMLPGSTAREIQSEIKFLVDDSSAERSVKKLEQYVTFYRQYQQFSKIVL